MPIFKRLPKCPVFTKAADTILTEASWLRKALELAREMPDGPVRAATEGAIKLAGVQLGKTYIALLTARYQQTESAVPQPQ